MINLPDPISGRNCRDPYDTSIQLFAYRGDPSGRYMKLEDPFQLPFTWVFLKWCWRLVFG